MKIGVLLFYNKINRGTLKNIFFDALPYYGFTQILKELKYKYEFINIVQINKYDYVLCSLTSIMDIENLINEFEKYKPQKGKCKIIIGGSGVININSLYDYIDIAVFGRAEGQINNILEGCKFDNVWRKEDDINLKKKYKIRQAKYLLDKEELVGCRNKCLFCQYSHIHKYFGKGNYNPYNAPFPEDDWRGLNITDSRRYLTAWDGFSETTRKKVCKNITDENIYDKLNKCYEIKRDKAITLKIYNIVGFPWEDETSINKDIEKIKLMLKKIDRRTGKTNDRVFIMMLITPFSPEPLTPLEKEKANIEINWNEYFKSIGSNIYKGVDFEIYVLPQINSNYTLAKRVLFNRVSLGNRDKAKNIALMNLNKYRMRSFKIAGIDYKIFGKLENKPIEYLEV